MRKLLITIGFIALLLAACNDENNEPVNEEPNETETENQTENTDDSNDNDTEDSEDEKEDNEETDSSSSDFSVNTSDQLDLSVGDTGTFDTTLGTYEVTLKSAKLEDEINGEASELDGFIVLDFKVKNTSKQTRKVEELIYSLEVTHNLEGSGFPDGAEFFDGYEKLSGELAPNEEMEGQFITYVYNSEEYYFRKTPGNVAAGSSNQVIWTIKATEAQ